MKFEFQIKSLVLIEYTDFKYSINNIYIIKIHGYCDLSKINRN